MITEKDKARYMWQSLLFLGRVTWVRKINSRDRLYFMRRTWDKCNQPVTSINQAEHSKTTQKLPMKRLLSRRKDSQT